MILEIMMILAFHILKVSIFKLCYIYIYIYIYIRFLSRMYFVERSTQLIEEHQL